MSSKKISDLTAAAAIADADTIEVVQSGANVKATFAAIKTWIQQLALTFSNGITVTYAGGLGLILNTVAAANRNIGWRTNGSNRWTMGATSTAESGSDAGSDFAINRSNDAGTFVDSPMIIERKTGKAQFLYAPVALKFYTVATLPAAATNNGSVALVTDALGPVKGANVTGGGAVIQMVVCDSANWKVL